MTLFTRLAEKIEQKRRISDDEAGELFASNDLLAYLGEFLAQSNRFDDESIEIMTKAFELRMVSKRAILILTEHCLSA